MMLDPSVLRAPLLDHRGLDLAAARRVNYVLQQSFRYEYDEPVESLRQRLVIVPPERHGNQHRRAHLLEVDGAPVRRRVRRDAYGNVVAWLQADRVTEAIEFRLAAVIERVLDDGPTVLPADVLHSPHLLRPTRLTSADGIPPPHHLGHQSLELFDLRSDRQRGRVQHVHDSVNLFLSNIRPR